jgi:hypothetical protein
MEENKAETLVYSATQGIFIQGPDGQRHIMRETLLDDDCVILPTDQGGELVEAIYSIFPNIRPDNVDVCAITKDGVFSSAIGNMNLTSKMVRALEGIHKRRDLAHTAAVKLDCIYRHKEPEKLKLTNEKIGTIEYGFAEVLENKWVGEEKMVGRMMRVIKDIVAPAQLVGSKRVEVRRAIQDGLLAAENNDIELSGKSDASTATDVVISQLRKSFEEISKGQGRS